MKKIIWKNRAGMFLNENGIALLMILVLSAILLGIMAGLIYIITSGTQMSGMQKRYKTALEAGMGGTDITYEFIARRGETFETNNLLADLSGLSAAISTPSTCRTLPTTPSCVDIGSYTGFTTKLKLPTSCWKDCDSSMKIDTSDANSYDLSFNFGVNPTYSVYSKIVDTVRGNTGGDLGLSKTPVVGTTGGEVAVKEVPYLYTIELDTENVANSAERSKLSILYQY